jgi:uncharacterized protein (TIGR00251 family)
MLAHPAPNSSPQAPITLLHIKAVPGAKSDAIVGPLGDRLKVRVRQPPEGGRANAAIIALLAEALNIAESNIELVRGQTNAEKTLRITGIAAAALNARWPA